MRSIAKGAVVVLALLGPVAARAADVGDGMLTINGNAEWWYGKSDQNRYLGADSDGTWRNERFDLLVTGHPREDIAVSAQMGFDRTGTATLQWMFGEWRVADQLRLRAGKTKQPLGNYSELQFIGTARPFLTLATAIYGPANAVVPGVVGVGATGTFHLGSNELQYDAYAGTQDLPCFDTFFVLLYPPGTPDRPAEISADRPIGQRNQLVESVVGGRLSFTFPFDLVIRASGWTGNLEKFDEGFPKYRTWVYGLSLWYRNDRFWFSAEGFRAKETHWDDQWSGYAEAAYFVLPDKLQLSARYEVTRVSVANYAFGSDPTLRHDETAAAIGWWFTPQAVVKAEVHFVHGKRFTRTEAEGAVYGDLPSERTNLYNLGVSFTF